MERKSNSRDIILILAASFFFMSCPMMINPIITGYAGTVGASADMMGILGGLMNLCSLVCRPFLGNAVDRISKYKLSFIGAACMFAATIGYIVSDGPVLIAVSRIIHGIGFASCSISMSTWLSNILPRDRVGSGMGLYGTMNALGMAIAPSVGVSIYQRFGYRPAFVLALFCSIAIAVIIQFVRCKGEPEPAAAPVGARLRVVEVRVLPIAAVIMLFTIPYTATQSFLVNYVEARGLDVAVSVFFPCYALVLLLMRLGLRNFFDRLPFRVFLFAGAASAAASLLCMSFMENSLVMLCASVFMAGGYGIMCSVCQSTAILLAGDGKRGLANSTYYVGLDLGMTLGPMLGGVLFGHLELSLFYPALLLTVPLILAVYFFTMRQKV